MEGRALPMVFSPSTCPDQRRGLSPSTWFGHQASVLRFLLEISSGLKITTDDAASSPMHLNQRREAKKRRVRGLVPLPASLKRLFPELELSS